jgi:hypothetical protein
MDKRILVPLDGSALAEAVVRVGWRICLVTHPALPGLSTVWKQSYRSINMPGQTGRSVLAFPLPTRKLKSRTHAGGRRRDESRYDRNVQECLAVLSLS